MDKRRQKTQILALAKKNSGEKNIWDNTPTIGCQAHKRPNTFRPFSDTLGGKSVRYAILCAILHPKDLSRLVGDW